MSRYLTIRWSVLAIGLLFGSQQLIAVSHAHPFHSTFAEVEWNEESQRVEVAYQIRSYDLEQALRAFHQQPIDLEKTDGLPKLLEEYFAATFYLNWEEGKASDTEGESTQRKSTIHWVGHEHTEKAAWVYFELDANGALDGKRLVNRVLIDILDEQSNVVELGMGHRVLTLQFDNRHSVRTIEKSSAKMRFGKSKRPRAIP
jgi:hypothetical protein